MNKIIEFPVFVNGKKTLATAQEIDHPIQQIYDISFSDGYHDEFLVDEETGRLSGTKDESKIYAKALSNDFHILMIVNPNNFYHVFQEEIDGIITNVWVVEDIREARPTYKVYYNSFYRFELQKLDDEWAVSDYSQANSKEIDPDLAKKVENLLYSLVD